MMSENTTRDVTIVCVTYQSRKLVESLCDTLRSFQNIIVIDNASTDGTVAAMRASLPHATIIENPGNDGYGKACNTAMRRVRTPLTLFLNPDCDIGPDALHKLIETMQRYPGAAIVAPQSFNRQLKPRKSYRQAFHIRTRRTPYRVPDATCSAQWVHGCCQLVRTHAYHLVEGFDERFFLFFEDDDLCLRMHEAGFSCLLEPAASIVHTGGGSSARNARTQFHRCFHYARSKYLITRKYLGKGAADRYLLKITLASVPVVLMYSLFLRRKHAVKWLAWGAAALACAFGQTPLSTHSGATGRSGEIVH